ncbi:MAG: hypothetical protein PS018_05315, partial [bacterium]|nr:hypothetical protein [bacterium]
DGVADQGLGRIDHSMLHAGVDDVMRRLKQLLCVHWFDVQPNQTRDEHRGAIVCNEQREFRVTFSERTCAKCGLAEERQIGEPEFLGWS